MKKQFKSEIMIFIATAFWGLSYIFTKISLDEIQPITIIGYRFGIAFLIASLFNMKQLMKINLKVVLKAITLSLVLLGGFIFQTTGLKHSTATNASFIIGLAIILVPVFSYIIFKEKQEKKVIVATIIGFTGIVLMVEPSMTIQRGDLFLLISTIFFALHILLVSHFTKDKESSSLGILQLLFVGIFAWCMAFYFEEPSLPSTNQIWGAILFLSTFCTAFGFIVQILAQRFTTATRTSLILATEPIFASIFGFLLLGEVMTTQKYFGGIILLLATFSLNFSFSSLKKKVETSEIKDLSS